MFELAVRIINNVNSHDLKYRGHFPSYDGCTREVSLVADQPYNRFKTWKVFRFPSHHINIIKHFRKRGSDLAFCHRILWLDRFAWNSKASRTTHLEGDSAVIRFVAHRGVL